MLVLLLLSFLEQMRQCLLLQNIQRNFIVMHYFYVGIYLVPDFQFSSQNGSFKKKKFSSQRFFFREGTKESFLWQIRVKRVLHALLKVQWAKT